MRIFLLTDYLGRFGSKYDASPYRSGMDKDQLRRYFAEKGYEAVFTPFTAVDYRGELMADCAVLYTSQEDPGYLYKSYIEDIVLSLELAGTRLIPSYEYLRANNNKVFMELLRKKLGHMWNDRVTSWVFGTYEEMVRAISDFQYPIVIKVASGAMSKGVFLAKNRDALVRKVKAISMSRNYLRDARDYLRAVRHNGYRRESLFRNKFVLQQFVPNLANDWKILIFGDKYFILTRHVRKNDFRASGSHFNYLPGSKAIVPEGIFDFAEKVFKSMNVPYLSIDVGFDGKTFYLFEFQALYFGTSTYNMSDVYFRRNGGVWSQYPNNNPLEQVFVESVSQYLTK